MTGSKSAKKKKRVSQFPPVEADLVQFERLTKTPQTESPSYRLAFVDDDFMRSDALRGARLQLEYLKPEMILTEEGIESTVIMFGGARIPAPGAKPEASTATARKSLKAASVYYEQARHFAELVSAESLRARWKRIRHRDRRRPRCDGGRQSRRPGGGRSVDRAEHHAAA